MRRRRTLVFAAAAVLATVAIAAAALEWLKLTIDHGPGPYDAPTDTSWGPFSWVRETQSRLTPS